MTMQKVIMGDGGFYCYLISEPQGVSAWWKETAQIRVVMLSPSFLVAELP